MKPIPLQLITVKLQNGQQGIFVGSPLIADQSGVQQNEISEIWFSDIKDLPEKIQLDELMDLVSAQLSRAQDTLH